MPPPCGAVGDALQQEQAVLRRGGKDAAPARFLHDVLVILCRLEAEQRELEAVLPARLAVAAAGVAAGFGEYRHDLVREIDRQLQRRTRSTFTVRVPVASSAAAVIVAVAIGERSDQAVHVDLHDAFWRGGVVHLAGCAQSAVAQRTA